MDKAATFRKILEYAVLAPSSHNSQPWRFEIGQDEISILKDLSRRLPISDANDRQLYISLGCAITNILVAADYFGFSVEVKYFPKGIDSAGVANICLGSNTQVQKEQRLGHLFSFIESRVTNRNKYESRLPEDTFLKTIKSFSTDELAINLVIDRGEKNQVADIVLASLGEAMADKKFRNELSHYLKSNITKSKTGMPGYSLGFPLMVSLIAPILIRYINVSKLSRKKDKSLLKEFTPLFMIVSTKYNDPLSWLKAGQIYQRIALLAESKGIKSSIMAAPIQIEDYYKRLQEVLKINFRPQIFSRLGYTTKVTPRSPRIQASALSDLV